MDDPAYRSVPGRNIGVKAKRSDRLKEGAMTMMDRPKEGSDEPSDEGEASEDGACGVGPGIKALQVRAEGLWVWNKDEDLLLRG